MRSMMVLTLAVGSLCYLSAQQMTIPALVARGDNPVVVTTIRELVDVPFSEVVSAASVVVEGTVNPVISYMTRDQRQIYTDYAVNVTETLRDRSPASTKPGPKGILVKMLGGTLTFQGVQVKYVDEDVPAWPEGTRLVLFLRESTGDIGKYELAVDGLFGAFAVTDQGMKPWIKAERIFRDFRNMPRGTFLERVRQEIAK